MIGDENRDSELDEIRVHWAPPGTLAAFDRAVLRAYRGEIARRRSAARYRTAAVAVTVIALCAGLYMGVWLRRGAANSRPVPVRNQVEYAPVEQPRLIVISQGERP